MAANGKDGLFVGAVSVCDGEVEILFDDGRTCTLTRLDVPVIRAALDILDPPRSPLAIVPVVPAQSREDDVNACRERIEPVRRRHSAQIDALRLECAKAGHIFQMRTGLHIGPPRICAVCGTDEPKEG